MRCDVFLDKFVQFEAAGGAIITGEYVTGVESSLARSIYPVGKIFVGIFPLHM